MRGDHGGPQDTQGGQPANPTPSPPPLQILIISRHHTIPHLDKGDLLTWRIPCTLSALLAIMCRHCSPEPWAPRPLLSNGPVNPSKVRYWHLWTRWHQRGRFPQLAWRHFPLLGSPCVPPSPLIYLGSTRPRSAPPQPGKYMAIPITWFAFFRPTYKDRFQQIY